MSSHLTRELLEHWIKRSQEELSAPLVSRAEMIELCRMALASASPPSSEPQPMPRDIPSVLERLSAGRDAVLDECIAAAEEIQYPDRWKGDGPRPAFERAECRGASYVVSKLRALKSRAAGEQK